MKAGANAEATEGRAGDGWQVALATLDVANGDVTLEHASAGGPRFEPLHLSSVKLEASSLATDASAAAPVRLSAAVSDGGQVQAMGTVVLATGASSTKLTLDAVPLRVVEPWLPADLNVAVVSGTLSGHGEMHLELPAGGSVRGDWRGPVAVADFGVRMKTEAGPPVPGSEPPELLHWKSLKLASLAVDLAPFSVDAGDADLDGLRTRLIINPDGRFNLQELVARQPGQASAGGSAGAPAPARAATPDAAPAAASTDAAITAIAGAAPPLPIRVGRVTVTGGNIDFSDYFIQPNYSANLTGVSGTIGALSAGKPGEIELAGRVDNSGSVKIAGRIDPIGEPLFLDVHADARDIDLPALSPYSAKYVGYGIEKGKLSASVEYHVENGQLTARNQVVLDQLTFGEHVESPDALKLPVLFAVSLLKDRNGVINVEVPVSGSLSDPEFSIGGIVMK
ncbi:MAG: DUF748 domain-containing protein, partial [Gammaproteobacteria bacterium]